MESDPPGTALMGRLEPDGLDEASTRRRDHLDPWGSYSWSNFSSLPVHLVGRMDSFRNSKTRRKLDDFLYQPHFPNLSLVARPIRLLVRPLIISRAGGEVKLKNSNPFGPPVVDPNFLSTDFDIKTMVAAIKEAKRFVTAKAWEGFVIAPWEPLASASTDEEIAQYVRDYASTYVKSLNPFTLRFPNILGQA